MGSEPLASDAPGRGSDNVTTVTIVTDPADPSARCRSMPTVEREPVTVVTQVTVVTDPGGVPSILLPPRSSTPTPTPPPSPKPAVRPPSRANTSEPDDGDFIELDSSDVPACPRCNDLCDLETLDGRWHCSRCDPSGVDRIRRTTSRLLMHVASLREI